LGRSPNPLKMLDDLIDRNNMAASVPLVDGGSSVR
jgi:hypothetical protein